MKKNFDEAAMLHSFRDCLFLSDSPLHQEFWNSLEQLIADRMANREGECLPCMFHDPRSLQAAVSAVQAKYIVLKQMIDALQLSTENATRAAANDLQRLEDEVSKNYVLLQEFVQSF